MAHRNESLIYTNSDMTSGSSDDNTTNSESESESNTPIKKNLIPTKKNLIPTKKNPPSTPTKKNPLPIKKNPPSTPTKKNPLPTKKIPEEPPGIRIGKLVEQIYATSNKRPNPYIPPNNKTNKKRKNTQSKKQNINSNASTLRRSRRLLHQNNESATNLESTSEAESESESLSVSESESESLSVSETDSGSLSESESRSESGMDSGVDTNGNNNNPESRFRSDLDSASESEYDPKSRNKNLSTDAYRAYSDILAKCQSEGWFNRLSILDKQYYKDLIKNIVTPDINIPTFQNILDLPVDKVSIKKLMINMFDLEELDRINPEYDMYLNKIVKKIKYYADEKNRAMIEKNKIMEKMLLENPRFSQSLLDRILSSPIDQNVRALLYDKYISHCIVPNDHDGPKYQEQIETILSIPRSSKKININTDLPLNEAVGGLLQRLMEKFNSKVYGMHHIKEEVLCTIVNMVANQESKFKALGMCGPPGVGKTMIARAISEVMDLPLQQISLGGVTDASFLEGHSFTYVGSEPGCITKAIIQMGYTNGIIYLDEVDKISKTEKGKEIEHALLHITDFTQNHDFRDKYMPEVPIDLSNYLFIYSMNTTRGLDSALASRIPMIQFDGYDHNEKLTILQDFLLPEITANYKLNPTDIIINPDVAKYLISKVHEEDETNGKSGVRGLKNILNKIIKRINLYKIASVDGVFPVKLSFKITDFKLPYSITTKLIDQMMTDPKQQKQHLTYFI